MSVKVKLYLGLGEHFGPCGACSVLVVVDSIHRCTRETEGAWRQALVKPVDVKKKKTPNFNSLPAFRRYWPRCSTVGVKIMFVILTAIC